MYSTKQKILSGRMIGCGVSNCPHALAGRFFTGAKTANIHVIENHMSLPDWREYLMDPGDSLPVSRCVTPPQSKSTSQTSAVPEAFMQAIIAQFAAMSKAAAQVVLYFI
jgi:hypothetical protein